MITKKQLNHRERESLAYIFTLGLLIFISIHISAAETTYLVGLKALCVSAANVNRDDCNPAVHPQAAVIAGRSSLGKAQEFIFIPDPIHQVRK